MTYLLDKKVPALSVANLKRMEADPATRKLRAAISAARKNARETRAKVDAYIAPVFAKFTFYDDALTNGTMRRSGQERIALSKDLYKSGDDAQAALFYAACDEEHKRQGYDIPTGHCPALIAESAEVTAENALLEHAEKYTGVPFGSRVMSLELRERALDILEAPPRF